MPPRPCLDCGTPTQTTRCTTCQRTHSNNRDRPHYQGDYPTQAKQVRDQATLCWICGQGPNPADPWQADHHDPAKPNSNLLPAHRSCNIRRSNQSRTKNDKPLNT